MSPSPTSGLRPGCRQLSCAVRPGSPRSLVAADVLNRHDRNVTQTPADPADLYRTTLGSVWSLTDKG